MSTWLSLAQDTARECGVAQGGTYPTAVTGQVGILNKIVSWVKDSWIEVQCRPVDWRWMRKDFTVNTVASTDSYAYGTVTDVETSAPITRLSRWRVDDPDDPPKIYLQASGVGTEVWLTYLPWDHFKSIFKIGTQTDGVPSFITIDPSDNVVLGPSPDAVYVVTGNYQRSPQEFSDGADEPEMPSQFHSLLMYEAMIKYGYDQSANEIVSRALNYSNMRMRQLEANQAAMLTLGEPLA